MSKFDGYTGHLFEEEVLGRCLAQSRGYMRWREAAEVVRKSQPRQKKLITTRLENEVSRQLGGRCTLYTAVRSAMDTFHGVDGFFEFEGTVVTVDLTMNPHKDSSKADLLVCRDELDDLSSLAGRIARELRCRMAHKQLLRVLMRQRRPRGRNQEEALASSCGR